MIARFCRALCALFVVLSNVAFLTAQSAPASTGVVMGRVMCADTQQPARLTHVVLQPLVDLRSAASQKEGRWAGLFHVITTGLDGSFVIPAVPPGLYYVVAEREGYISPLAVFTREDLNHPDEGMLRKISRYMTPISVVAGRTTQAQVSLVRGAVVTGSVHYEDGAPAVSMPVTLLQKDGKGGWKPLHGHIAEASSTSTDDQGAFRFSGVPAGEYLVSASLQLDSITTSLIFSSENGGTSWGDGYHLSVFPGDVFRARDAKPVKVNEGESVAGVDVDVPLSKLYSISGTVLRPGSSAPANAAHVKLEFVDDHEELATAEVGTNDGAFHFQFVPGGSYVLKVTGVALVDRTEVPNCTNGQCVPPTHIESKTVATFGDASQTLEVTSDQSGVMVRAGAAAKP